MAEYISSFTTGFGEVVSKNIHSLLKGVNVLGVYDGLIRYMYHGNPNDIKRILFFNNTYYILRFFQGKQLSFSQMVYDIASRKLRYLKAEGTFRVRFSRSNQFVKIEKQITLQAEIAVSRFSRLKIDRLNPTTELWYILWDEGIGFYGQLLEKRAATEKNTNKGELRPELAYLMCCCAEPNKNSVIMDPFAGFGSIPIQIKKNLPFGQLIANDVDREKIRKLRQMLPSNDSRIQVLCKDALMLTGISDENIDVIITDPPWGYYNSIDDIVHFYEKMLLEFRRILKKNGRLVLLSARKEEFMEAVKSSRAFVIENMLHTLVNGKKAAVFILRPNQMIDRSLMEAKGTMVSQNLFSSS